MTPRKSSPLSLQIAADILKTVGPVDEKKLMQPHSVWATRFVDVVGLLLTRLLSRLFLRLLLVLLVLQS